MAADCICQRRAEPHRFPLDYPTLRDGEDPIQVLNKEGYFLVRGLLSSKEVEESRDAISDICKKWYANFVETGKEGPDWEEVANRRPAWKNGSWKPEPGQEELGFRRLYRMTQFEDYFVRMCRHSEVSIIPLPCCRSISPFVVHAVVTSSPAPGLETRGSSPPPQ